MMLRPTFALTRPVCYTPSTTHEDTVGCVLLPRGPVHTAVATRPWAVKEYSEVRLRATRCEERLSLEERLDLEDPVLPLLDPRGLLKLWLERGFPLSERVARNGLNQWRLLLALV